MPEREFPVTLIMVSYNKADTVGLAIESAAKGSMPPDLIVISDDGSNDGTPDVAEATAKKCGIPLRLIRHQRVGTFRLQTMRNTCAANSLDGGIVFLSDSDCLFGEYAVESHYEMHRKHKLAVATGPRFEFLTGNSGAFTTTLASLEYAHYHTGAYVVPVGANVSFPKALWERLGFDRAYEGAYGMDEFEFSYRAMAAGAVAVSDPAAYVFHIPHETVFGHRRVTRNIDVFNRDQRFDHVPFESDYIENHVVPWYWSGNRKRPLIGSRAGLDDFWGVPKGFVPPPTLHLMVSLDPIIRRATDAVRNGGPGQLREYLETIEEYRMAITSPARSLFQDLKWHAYRDGPTHEVLRDIQNWIVGAKRLDEEMTGYRSTTFHA